MMLPSHLLAIVLGGQLASRWRPFTRTQWTLALGLGVAMDVDHLLQLPVYVATHGAAGLDVGAMLRWGSEWQGFMHTPWALVLVVPACLAFRSTIPAAAWGLHLVLDFVVARHFVRWGGPAEWLIVGALAAAVVALASKDGSLGRARGAVVALLAAARPFRR